MSAELFSVGESTYRWEHVQRVDVLQPGQEENFSSRTRAFVVYADADGIEMYSEYFTVLPSGEFTQKMLR